MNRIKFIDVARGIGILCVLMGHLKVSKLYIILFMFQIPLFFLISGYLIDKEESIKLFAIKRIKKLLIPYIMVGIITIVYKIIKGNNFGSCILSLIYGCGNNANMNLFGIERIGAIWFLFASFFSQIIVKTLINCVSKERTIIIVLFALFIISYISSIYVWLPLSIQAAGTASTYVYIGYLAKIKKCKFVINKNNVFLIPAAITAVVYQYINNYYISIAINKFDVLPISIITSIVMSYLLVCLSKIISSKKNSRITKLLTYCGKNSLVFLCCYSFEEEVINWNNFESFIALYSLNPFFKYFGIFLTYILRIMSTVFIGSSVVKIRLLLVTKTIN